MTVSNASYLKTFYDATKALGKKAINSDFTFEIEGFEQTYLLAKQCPWPDVAVAGEIEVPSPLGATLFEPQQIKVAHQGQVSFLETVAGSVDQALVDIIANGGTFNAKIYEGTPDKHLRYKRITDCFLQIDDPDRDWENRSQVLTFSGTMFFHYFGELVQGNTADYR